MQIEVSYILITITIDVILSGSRRTVGRHQYSEEIEKQNIVKIISERFFDTYN